MPQNSENKAALLRDYLTKNAVDFNEQQKSQIEREVLRLLNNSELAEIFGENSRAEVPIMGEVEGKIISAQLDRLVVLPQKIMIVDFKTNRPAAKTVEDTPDSYIKQLEVYAKLVQKIYPEKAVESYILWTNETRLMRVR